MFSSVRIVGHGRVGSAIAARLAEREVTLADERTDLVLLCVPDSVIAEVARTIAPGPWVAHVSGATPLAALEPHTLRFGMHPLQTFARWRGPEQLDGAWSAVTGETVEAVDRGRWLAEILGLKPFVIDDANRAMYHAGASIASNYLV